MHCSGNPSLGLIDQTLFNWVKAPCEVKLKGAGHMISSSNHPEQV